MDQQPPPAGPLPDATSEEGPPNAHVPVTHVLGATAAETEEFVRAHAAKVADVPWDPGVPIVDETRPLEGAGSSGIYGLAERTPPTTEGLPPFDPPTKGIPRAENRPGQRSLHILQSSPNRLRDYDLHEKVAEAAWEVSIYHAPVGDQVSRHMNLSAALANFLIVIVENVPAGPERSTAISRAREAKMWASAGVALEPKP